MNRILIFLRPIIKRAGLVTVVLSFAFFAVPLQAEELLLIPGVVKKIERRSGSLTVLGLEKNGTVHEFKFRVSPEIRTGQTWKRLQVGNGVDIHVVMIENRPFARSILPRARESIPLPLRERAKREGIPITD